MEIGNLGSFVHERSHFGLWTIVSSPLILGHNLLDNATNDRIWPIVTNKAAIEVSQRLGCGVAMKLLTPLLRIERCDKLIEDLPGKQRSRTQFSFASQTTVNGGCHAVGSLAERLGLVDRFPQRAQVFTDDLHQSQNIKTETSSVRARCYVPLSGIQEKMAL